MKTKYLVILLALVVIFSMMLLIGDNAEYLSIVTERASVAKSVSSGKVDFEVIKRDYENCIYRMQRFEEKSDYCMLLSSIDSMNAGKLVNYLLIFGQIVITWIAFRVFGRSIRFIGRAVRPEAERKLRRVWEMIQPKQNLGKYATAERRKTKVHRAQTRGKYAA